MARKVNKEKLDHPRDVIFEGGGSKVMKSIEPSDYLHRGVEPITVMKLQELIKIFITRHPEYKEEEVIVIPVHRGVSHYELPEIYEKGEEIFKAEDILEDEEPSDVPLIINSIDDIPNKSLNIPPVVMLNEYGNYNTSFQLGLREFSFNSFKAMTIAFCPIDEFYHSRVEVMGVVPRDYGAVFKEFGTHAMNRVRENEPQKDYIYMIGGDYNYSMDVVYDWDDIVLSPELKKDIQGDVREFFDKGVGVYKDIGINPFRKIMLAGLPGTGKTMICSALANEALDNGYTVVYISGSDREGASFRKIRDALNYASGYSRPAIIVVEEIDTYFNEDYQRASILNILDGSETPHFEYGCLMLMTTNFPENIESRVIKRPGRIDRIFIIPETQNKDVGEELVKKYLRDHWRDEFMPIVNRVINQPASFVREVCLYALTKACYNDDTLTLEMLNDTIDALEQQIDEKENFISKQSNGLGFTVPNSNGKTKTKNPLRSF